MKCISALLVPSLLLTACATTSEPTPESRFRLADTNADGLVSRQEAAAFMVAEAFALYDENDDGYVDREEFAEAGGSADTFRRINRSGTGRVTLAEAKANPRVAETFLVSFDEADVNGNGAITYQEYVDYIARLEAAVR